MDEVAIAAGHKLASVVGLPQHLQERVLALVNAQDERLLGLLASVDLDNIDVEDVSETLEMLFANMDPIGQAVWLPVEIWMSTFMFLQPHDIGRVALVCKEWSVLAHDEQLWAELTRKLVERRWWLQRKMEEKSVDTTWMDTYRTLHALPAPAGLEDLPMAITKLKSSEVEEQVAAARIIRKVLSVEQDPPIDLVLSAGAVPLLAALLDHTTPELVFEVVWALTNIASGTQAHVDHITAEEGAVDKLCTSLLEHANSDVREQAVWCIGNIASTNIALRDYILGIGTLGRVLAMITNTSQVSAMRNSTWTLSNLVRGKPQPDWGVVSEAIPTLGRLIYSNDDEIVTDALWALSYLSDGPNDHIQAVVDAGVVRRVVELLLHAQPVVTVPALRVVGNILTGNDLQTQTVINCSAIPCLVTLLSSRKNNIRKEALWSFSNILAGSANQIDACVDVGVVAKCLEALQYDSLAIGKEAAWCLGNMTSGASKATLEVVMTGNLLLPALATFAVRSRDPHVIQVVVAATTNICDRFGVETELVQAAVTGALEVLDQVAEDDAFLALTQILEGVAERVAPE